MIKRLAQCIREYTVNAILSPIFVAIECVFDILIPYVMSLLLKEGIEGANNKVTVQYGVILAVMAVVALIFGALSGAQCARASCGFAKNLRKDMFYAVQNYSFKNIDKFSPSSLVTRMTTDVNFVQTSFMMIIRIAIRAPLMLIFGVIMTAIISGPMIAIFLLVIPFMAAALLIIFKKAHPIFQKLFPKYDKLNSVVEENVRGMRVVKSNVREDYETEKFYASSEDIYKQFTSATRIVAFNGPVMQTGMYLCITLVAWFGAKMIVESGGTALSTSELTTLVTYVTQILMSLMMLSMVYVNINISKASAERICEVLNEAPDIVSPSNAVTEVKDGSIDYENVNFSYLGGHGPKFLNHINLHIDSGETIGIIGATGSSKSTFVQLIPRLFDVTGGAVKVGGVDVREYDLDSLRRGVAMVLQKNILFSGTIRDNLKWGNPDATDDEINEVIKLACADEFVYKLNGLDTYIEQGGANISGGQRQRLCIARALLAEPKVLILDDSTSAVDMNTDLLIRKALREYVPATTKIIIAQRIASVMDADRIVVLDGGEINAVGNHAELMETCEIYREVYTSQQGGGDFDVKNG